jgi:hypothetical protein
MSDHPTVELSVPRCYCLCLSEKQNDLEMYARFDADVCIAVQTDVLIEFLENHIAKRIPIRVAHRNVTYYPNVMKENPPLEEALIFYKEEAFSVEAEYRIALIIPERVYFICDGKTVSVLEGDEPSFIHIGHKDKAIWSEIFKTYTLRSDVIQGAHQKLNVTPT